jgi:hypothetical protein
VIHKAFKWFFSSSEKPIFQNYWSIIDRVVELEEKYLCLLEDVKRLEEENIETTNELYRLENSLDARIDILASEPYNLSKFTLEKIMYESLTDFERALARFGDKVALIAGLEINDKISPENAYQEIKELYKELKSLRKVEKKTWETDIHIDV